MKDILKIGVAFLALYLCKILVFTESKTPESQTVEVAGKSFSLVDEDTPPCIQMHYYLEKYAAEYGIPLRYAYGVANCETGYKGAFHWKYNPAQTSCVGAVGPMQVMPATASWVWKSEVSAQKLREDIRFNVETSMKYLQHLHKIYGDWKVVFGCYNTGKPMINGYALEVFNYQMPHLEA